MSEVPLSWGNWCAKHASGGNAGICKNPVCVEWMMLLSGSSTLRGISVGFLSCNGISRPK